MILLAFCSVLPSAGYVDNHSLCMLHYLLLCIRQSSTVYAVLLYCYYSVKTAVLMLLLP